MRTSNRKNKAIGLVTAAASLTAAAQLASAQVWNNPAGGNWNVAGNWTPAAVPASANTTQLTFNATGNTYTATNDVANPFLLNLMTLNNTGAGQINLAGQQLSFGGTNPGINNTGSGVSAISNNIQSTTASVPLAFGGAGTGTTILSGGGTLYSLDMTRGAVNMTGGTLVLTSTNRRNDVVAGINDGFWSFNIGDTAGQTARFTQTGGTIDAQHGMIGIFDGSVGYATFSGASSVATFSSAVQARFGMNAGQGTWTVENGARVTGTFFEVGRQANATANSFITGGATLSAVTQVLVGRSAGGNGSLTVNSAGWLNGGSNSFVGAIQGASGTLIVTGPGSRFENVNRLITGGGGATGGNANIIVNNGGSIRSGAGYTFTQNNGGSTNVTIDGPTSVITSLGIGAGTGSWGSGVGNGSQATINVTNGGSAGIGGALFMSGGVVDAVGEPIPSGTTTFNITGSGANTSTASIGFLQMAQSPNGQSTYNANTLSTTNVASNLIVGLNPAGTATLNVGGASAVVNTPGFSAPFPATTSLGDPVPGGNGSVAVTNAGRINMTSFGASIANNPDQLGVVTISGTNSRIIGTGTAQLVVAGAGTATMSIASGGAFDTSGAGAGNGNAFFSADIGGVSTTTVNAGTMALGGQMQIGGSGGDDGGTAVVTATNGGVITNAGTTLVYTPGTLNVGTGTSVARYSAGAGVAVDGTINYNAGTFNAAGTLDVAGNVLLSSAARNGAGTPSNKKMLEVGQATLTTSGVIDLNDNDMLIHDGTAGARQKYENFVKVARNSGLWNMPGITSTAAKNSVPKNKNLGVLSGTEYLAVNGTPFNGKTVLAGDTVIKFTFNGDTDFNGVVNFDDYARADSGFNNTRSGWLNGDFDYNGVVNFDDYALIDQAFNTQGAVILSSGQGELAGPGLDRTIVRTEQGVLASVTLEGHVALTPDVVALNVDGGTTVGGGKLRAVPEPAMFGLFGVAMLGSLRRTRRSKR